MCYCVNFGSQTIAFIRLALDVVIRTSCPILILFSPQPTAQNTVYIHSAGLFEVGLQTDVKDIILVGECMAFLASGSELTTNRMSHSCVCTKQ